MLKPAIPHIFVKNFPAAGAHIWQKPRDEPWAMRSLIVNDPNGNLICFAHDLPR